MYALYEALEGELQSNSSHPCVEPIYFPDELNRLHFLEQDLDYYYDNNWRHLMHTAITPGMQRYVARIREIGASKPELLIAHSYTRYLGDMSGGQILRRLLKKRYSLPDDNGLSFYQFDHVESIAKLKDLYTVRMNGIQLDEEGMTSQVAEANQIFRFNIAVFDEIGAMFNDDKADTPVVPQSDDSSVKSVTSLPADWSSVVRMAYVTVGVSATVMMLCPWFRGMVLK